jgi:hypothetical protein
MEKHNLKWIISILLFIATLQVNLVAQNQIPNDVFSSGGKTLSGTNNQIYGTIGQSFIGIVSNLDNKNLAGFWFAAQGIVTSVEQDLAAVPVEYFLSQNFPNPFNPKTKINFGVKESGQIKIIVFNSIGEEITILVNEEKEPGVYEVEFNAASLSSGVYFYQIQTASFVQTNKMILIK